MTIRRSGAVNRFGDLAGALAWLEDHVNLEAVQAGRGQVPSLARMKEMTPLLGEPQRDYPVIHLTGTNGKGSTARILTALLMARGLRVGTYTSPNLERVNERVAWDAEPIPDDAFTEVLGTVASVEDLLAKAPSRFEILTAAALRWFADIAVDVAVVEVGLGGRRDATNVADGSVAVVTNVSLDHLDSLGPTLADIATEKAGIVKPGATLVLGVDDPGLRPIFRAAGASQVWERHPPSSCAAPSNSTVGGNSARTGVPGDAASTDVTSDPTFGCDTNRLAHGGRLIDVHTPGARYPDLYLPLHGSHQGDNLACALAAAEAFFAAPLDAHLVAEALNTVRIPGRMEVVGRSPLCILDGAHNPAGARAAGVTLAEDFAGVGQLVVVMGLLAGRRTVEMLEGLGPRRIRLVVATPPPSPRALPPEEVAAAASHLKVDSVIARTTAEALEMALDEMAEDEALLVTGSLYLVGEARAILLTQPPGTLAPGTLSPETQPPGTHSAG